MTTLLRHLRLQSNLTQGELAQLVEVSLSIVSDWERLRRYPSRKNAKKLEALFLGYTVEQLMTEIDYDRQTA